MSLELEQLLIRISNFNVRLRLQMLTLEPGGWAVTSESGVSTGTRHIKYDKYQLTCIEIVDGRTRLLAPGRQLATPFAAHHGVHM